MFWVQHCAQGPKEKQSTEVGFHVHLCTRTKRGLILGLSSTKREEYFYFFFFVFLLTPREGPELGWSHFRSAIALSPLAGLTIPHTVLCLAGKSVGKILPLIGIMGVSYKPANMQKKIFVDLQCGVWNMLEVILNNMIVYRVSNAKCLAQSDFGFNRIFTDRKSG